MIAILTQKYDALKARAISLFHFPFSASHFYFINNSISFLWRMRRYGQTHALWC